MASDDSLPVEELREATGSAFFARAPEANTMQLSLVTVSPAEVTMAIERLAEVIREAPVGSNVPQVATR